jgi:periplasmic copper chaperone A
MFMRRMNSNELHIGAIAALVLLALTAQADASGTSVSNGWIRKLPSGLPAAGYFDLHNGGDKTITLTGASSPGCGMLMLHRSENMGGMMHMDDVSGVDVAPGATVKFAPGGYHLMCMGSKPSLTPGSTVPVTLIFADGSKPQFIFSVRDANGK